ncbi:serine/threonine-protein kinase [Tautonia sociabilis]|uniref:non-specific serine/threonine protein kinase n=1 Tax=Tautonia sociabilis TaxID=2080755 RepID=A0A432MM87_9BACT|nr:serine/threonine-protein kinase [Tautonia sociabilis]RUL88554.1 serine/threonine protein kinase [Tautonia sociabilis]
MIGQRLGSFLIEAKIGSGAMGEVYKATQQLKDGRTRTAAVKVVSADFLERDLALKRFQREAEILAQLRHPHIVRYYAHGKFQGTYYYAMEFVEGETLDAVLERQGFLPWQQVVELGIQLCQALQYAHDHQVVHRDLKPSNLMITRDGRLKLTDFGIAKDLDATVNLTRTGRTLGTAAYMAPEQIRGNPPISHKTDLYALGCLLYQMLTGRPPFEGKSAVVLMHAHMAEPAPRPSSKTPDVPRALDDLVVQLMSKEPPDRPWDAAQVAHLLQELRDRTRRGDRVEMAFDRARKQVAASGGVLVPDANGDGHTAALPRPGAPTAGTGAGTRSRKSGRSRSSRAKAGADSSDRRRRMLETGGLALALVGLVALLAVLLWPPSMESLYAEAEKLMASDRRSDWKRAIQYKVEQIERRFPDHPYTDQFSQWRDRIALDEARGRSVQLESPTRIGEPRADQPAEAMYKKVISDIGPMLIAEQHAQVARRWGELAEELARLGDPEQRGWLLLAREKQREHLEKLAAQKRAALTLLSQAELSLRNDLTAAARTQLDRLIADYSGVALGDPEFLGIIARADAMLKQLEARDDPDSPDSPGDQQDPEA